MVPVGVGGDVLVLFLTLSYLSTRPNGLPVPNIFSDLGTTSKLDSGRIRRVLRLPSKEVIFAA